MISSSEGLHKLADKLQNANRTIVLEKKREKEEIEERLQALQNKISQKKKFESDSLNRMKSTNDQLTKLYAETIRNFSIKSQKEEEVIRSLKDQMENDLQFEEREHESRIDEIIEKETENMSMSVQLLTKKSKNSTEKHYKMISDLNKLIGGLEREIQEEVQAREQNSKRIKEDVIQQINKFSQLLQREDERRSNSIKKLYEMMEEISGKLTTEIEEQGNKRKKNNEAVLKLIECACQKLQQKIRS